MYDVDYSERDISFKLEGKSFDDGYDFNDTLASLNYFQDILDKAYLTIVNKDRMSKVDRAVFKIKATDIRHGSFITDLMLYTGAAIQVAYPVINTYYPSLLLDVTKQGFEYLKTVLKANKEDIEIVVSPVGMPGRAIHNQFLERLKNERERIDRCFRCIISCNPTNTPYCITKALINAVKGNVDNALLFCGAEVYRLKEMTTVKKLMQELVMG